MKISLRCFLVILLLLAVPSVVPAQGTAFTYQGRLNDGANPASGVYDFTFGLFSVSTGDGQIGVMSTNNGVAVSNGLFTVTLDFGGEVFSGETRWLEIGVRTNGGGAFTLLTPRHPLSATPYAITASSVTGMLPATQLAGSIPSQSLAGIYSSAVELENFENRFAGIFMGNGEGLTNLPGVFRWQVVAGGSQQAQPNTGYVVTNAGATIILPAAPKMGDTIRVSGAAYAWTITQNSGQRILTPAFNVGNATGSGNWFAVASSSDGAKLVAATEFTQLFTSTDSGANWISRDSARSWRSVASSADGARLVGVVNGGQIYTSADSGINWTPRESNRTWRSVASSSDGSRLVAVVGGGQIYTSVDFGVTWTARESNRSWQSVASSADGSKLVAVVGSGQIYTSINGGTNWTPREIARSWSSVASSSDGARLVATVVGGQIYTSADSGTNWTARESSRNWWSIASSSDGAKLVAAARPGTLYTSSDSGTNWIARNGSDPSWQCVASSADGTKLIAMPNPGQIHTSTNSGVTWRTPIPGTLPGTGGYLSGGPFTAIELQYIGGGLFYPLSHEGNIFAN